MRLIKVILKFILKGTLLGLIQFLGTESPLKVMKNASISSQNLFSFLRYFNFCPAFFGHVGKRMNKKAKVKFKIYYHKLNNKNKQL